MYLASIIFTAILAVHSAHAVDIRHFNTLANDECDENLGNFILCENISAGVCCNNDQEGLSESVRFNGLDTAGVPDTVSKTFEEVKKYLNDRRVLSSRGS